MSLGFGLISCQRSAGDPRTWTDLYREALRLCERAEELGYASVWTTEHHFVDDGYMPSLLTMSAAIAARTSSIDIGTGVVLAPLHHPLRLAEDAATVQLISAGRLLLGLGLGWMPAEFEALGAELTTRGKAMEEILTILPQAWTGRPVDHHGTVYDVPGVGVRPTPDKDIPILIGGGAEAAVRRAARRAHGFFSNASPRTFARQIAWANDEMDRNGRDPSTFRWIYYTVMFPGPDPDTAWERGRAHIHAMRAKYPDMEASARRDGMLQPPPPLEAEAEERLRKASFVGPPEHLAEQITALTSDLDVDVEIVARSYFPTLTYGEQDEVLEELADVIPLLA